MRLNARSVACDVALDEKQESSRPIHMRIGAITYSMPAAEALTLAHQLADAVTQVKSHERTTP